MGKTLNRLVAAGAIVAAVGMTDAPVFEEATPELLEYGAGQTIETSGKLGRVLMDVAGRMTDGDIAGNNSAGSPEVTPSATDGASGSETSVYIDNNGDSVVISVGALAIRCRGAEIDGVFYPPTFDYTIQPGDTGGEIIRRYNPDASRDVVAVLVDASEMTDQIIPDDKYTIAAGCVEDQ